MTAPAAPARPTPATPGQAGDATEQRHFPASPVTIAHARAHVHTTLTTWRVPPELRADAVLVTSELATNAVAHADAPGYTVTCTLLAHAVEIGVSHTTGGPCVIRAGTPAADDEHGRGLLILTALTTEWGNDRHADGVRIWARLNLPSADPYDAR